MTSRFLQLFKRGRYISVRSLASAEDDEATRERKHHERERFCVAAIAFCLEHDEAFKAHFLHVMAGLDSPDIPSVTLEPESWGDLVLEGPCHVFVIEFKLGAMLQEHQSPAAPKFSEKGYGAKILERFSKSGKTLRYIVIGKDFPPLRVEGLECNSVPWPRFLVSDDRPESKMEADLYNCLGYLGASVFLYRHMKNQKLHANAKGAMNIFAMLQHVLDAQGLSPSDSESGPEFVGVTIKRTSAAPGSSVATLMKLVDPPTKSLGWIGYEARDEGKLPFLSVWFYASAPGSSVVRQRLELVKATVGGEVRVDQSAVGISLLGDKSNGDAEWFESVLRGIAQAKVK